MALVKTILLNLPIIIALMMLGIAPVFILQDAYTAIQIAGIAFHLLISGVIWKILQYLLNKYQSENVRADNKVEKQT